MKKRKPEERRPTVASLVQKIIAKSMDTWLGKIFLEIHKKLQTQIFSYCLVSIYSVDDMYARFMQPF